MKNSFLKIIALISVSTISCKTHKSSIQTVSTRVSAPFEMPAIVSPNFQNVQSFSIVDFGAEQNNKQANSEALERAIAEASQRGGGKVVVPKGTWKTGKIHFKSNVDLHLEEGAVLLFSDNPEDYLPAVLTTWEGMECYNYSPLIYAYKCENIAITGKGELRAEMGVWQTWFSRPPAHLNSLKRLYHLASTYSPVEDRQMVNDTAHLRPQFIQFNRCENVLLEDVKIRNSPFWVIHPYLSKNVIIRGLDVYAHGHNNDGVDPEMSQNVLIENCVFDQGDDAIAVKSGRNQDAWRLNTPTKNVVIRNCKVKNGHQLLAIGSELSGGVENVWMDNCEVMEGSKLYHLLFIKTNERRGGFVKNIYFTNNKAHKVLLGILGIETDVLYQWKDLVPTYEVKLTPIENVFLHNIYTGEAEFISRIKGTSELPVKNVKLKNVKAGKVTKESLINSNVIDFEIL